MRQNQISRLKKLIITSAVVILCGVAYYVFVRVTGTAAHCIIYEITGFACPGCGVTRMFLALARFDIIKAAKSNLFLFIMLLPILAFLIRRAVIYVACKNSKYAKWEKALIIITIIAAIAFGVLRNMPQFSFLYPI